jgi:hypothetical protein
VSASRPAVTRCSNKDRDSDPCIDAARLSLTDQLVAAYVRRTRFNISPPARARHGSVRRLRGLARGCNHVLPAMLGGGFLSVARCLSSSAPQGRPANDQGPEPRHSVALVGGVFLYCWPRRISGSIINSGPSSAHGDSARGREPRRTRQRPGGVFLWIA